MNLTVILKTAAEEIFWLAFALVLAWYAAVTWPLSGSLSTFKFTLLYFPFLVSLVFIVKESFFRYARFTQMLITSLGLAFSLGSVFILYTEYARQFFRDQVVPLSEAIKANDLMNIWAVTAQQPKGQSYFLTGVAFLTLLLTISAILTGRQIPRNR